MNLGTTMYKVFGRELTTYFDGPDSSGDWVGLDFGIGVSNLVGLIKYCPRATYASRMVNGVFQGANNSSFTAPVTFFTVTPAPAYSALSSHLIRLANAFRDN